MIRKTCSKCKTEKALSDFNKNKKREDGVQSHCRDCTKLTNKNTYDRLPQRRDKIRETNQKVYKANKAFVQRLKRIKGCSYCKEKDEVCMDFHHLDPTEKEGNPSTFYNYSRKTLKAELRKCIILCANCHRKEHARLRLMAS